MIESTTVSGRPALVAYIGSKHSLVEPNEAVLIKVQFTDKEGGVVFLVGPQGSAEKK